MATQTSRRAELAAALAAASVTASDAAGRDTPPYVLMYGGGIDPRDTMRGQMRASVRIVAIAAKADAGAASVQLAGLVESVLAVLRALAGWRIDGVSSDLRRIIAGAEYLSADISASCMIDV